MKARVKALTAVIASLILLMAAPLVLADQLVKVTIVSGEVFQNTGYNFKSWTVDVSKIKDAREIKIKITGSASGDLYARYLCVKIDGQIVNQRSLSGKPWSGYTAIVSRSFDVSYDVTSLVKGKSSVKVEIGITTFTGSWTISAEFNGVLEDITVIPSPGGGEGWSIPTAWLAAGGGIACIAGAWYLRSKELE